MNPQVFRRFAVFVLPVVLIALLLINACGAEAPSAPSPVTAGSQSSATTGCSITVAAEQLKRTVGSGAGTISISVTTGASCVWSASTTDSFLAITAGAAGTGSGVVQVNIAENTGTERTGTVHVGAATVSVTQEAAPAPPTPVPTPTPTPEPTPTPTPTPQPTPTPPTPTPGPLPGACVITVAPLNVHVGANGGRLPITVTAQGSNCDWTASPTTPHVMVDVNRKPEGIVELVVSPNTGPARTGTAIVAGQTVTVTQDAVAPTTCVFSISPARVSLPAGGGTATFSVHVTQGTACAWTAYTIGDGLTVTSAASGVGDGTVVVAVAANPGTERTGAVRIGGQDGLIYQPETPGACAFAATPQSFNISSASQNVQFDLTITTGAPGICQWTAGTYDYTQASVVSLTPSGNTTRVVVWVAENTGYSEVIRIITAGPLFIRITQAGRTPPPCLFTVTPTNVSAPAAESTATLTVTLKQGINTCAWDVTTTANFIGIVWKHEATGGGTVSLTILANKGAARSGSLWVAGIPVIVSQAGATPPPETEADTP